MVFKIMKTRRFVSCWPKPTDAAHVESAKFFSVPQTSEFSVPQTSQQLLAISGHMRQCCAVVCAVHTHLGVQRAASNARR